MEGGQGGAGGNQGEDQWTTIDRKASKKKNRIEEPAGEGWEQVKQKDRRKKDSVASNNSGGENRGKQDRGGYRGGNSERGQGGGYRGKPPGGRGGGSEGGGRGTLPRKNSKPRGGGRGGQSGRGTTSPSPVPPGAVGRGTTPPQGRGATPPVPQSNRGNASPSPVPQPVPTQPPPARNTWAAKISSQDPTTVAKPAVDTEQTKHPTEVQQPRKFSWANVNQQPVRETPEKESSIEPIVEVKVAPTVLPDGGKATVPGPLEGSKDTSVPTDDVKEITPVIPESSKEPPVQPESSKEPPVQPESGNEPLVQSESSEEPLVKPESCKEPPTESLSPATKDSTPTEDAKVCETNTNTTEEKPNIPSDITIEHTTTNNSMQLNTKTIIEEATEKAIPESKTEKLEEIETPADVIDNGNPTVISDVAIADSNGNFATDSNENISDHKPVAIEPIEVSAEVTSKVANDEVIKLTNGDLGIDEDESKPLPEESKDPEVTPKKVEVLENGIDDKQVESELPYKDDQWSPANKEGKKQYDRDFLMKLQTNPLSLQKPETLPNNMEVILNSPALENIRSISSAPNLNRFDMNPQYIRSSASHSRTPRRGDSRKKDSHAGRQGAAKVITLPNREEVKLNEAENAWKPSKKAADVSSSGGDEVEDLSKKIRSILNKLCPQKFDKLVAQFNELVIDTEVKLTKAMELVFEKAVDEPGFSVAYARMCLHLSKKKVESGSNLNFRTLLLKRCQEEFIKDYMEDLDRQEYVTNLAKAETEEERKAITAEFNAQEMKLRKRSLGNIRFIGELYKIKMLNGRIMHECIRKLLVQTDEESLECLCRLVTTVGQILEQETAAVLAKDPTTAGFSNLDIYFTEMGKLVVEKKTSSRVRFLMQDVIDLRRANWVKRREEAGPKTIEQIHEEVQKEALRVKIANMTPDPPPSRRSEDRSDRRRSQINRGKENSRGDRGRQDEGWNNVPQKAAKINEKVDPSKLKISKVDVSSMSFGPPGGSKPGGFGNWSRGSASASHANKKMSMQEPPALKQVNRFALFGDDDGGSVTMPPPASTYHGRASEPAYRTGNYGGGPRSRDNSREGYVGRGSREGSYSGRHSREGSYSGRNSREGSYSGRTSREGSRLIETEVIREGVASILKGKPGEDQSKLEGRTKPILDEYLHNVDLMEAFTCISELYHIETIHWLVEVVFNTVVERKQKDRITAGKLFGYLLKNESLPRKEFVRGVNAVLEFAEDLLLDIPQFWEYFADMIGPILVEKTLDIGFLQETSSFLMENRLAGKYVAAVLTQMARVDLGCTVEQWQRSGLSFKDFNVDSSEQFIKDNKLEFLEQPIVNGVKSNADSNPKDSLSDHLDALLSKNDYNLVFGFIDEKYPEPRGETLIRTLVSRVILSCIDGVKTNCVLNEANLRSFGVPILKKYLDAVKATELQALYSLQALVNSLEHPNKLLHSIFDVLYDCDVISEDAFIEWEESTEPGEQEGKGVALKSCTQFFQWLKTAELEDEEEEQPQKVSFQIGEDSINEAERVEGNSDQMVNTGP